LTIWKGSGVGVVTVVNVRTVGMTRGGVGRVPDERLWGQRDLAAERAGRVELQAVVPVLAHTVDELARHVDETRAAEALFVQAADRKRGKAEE
jgi:hypothetical protein